MRCGGGRGSTTASLAQDTEKAGRRKQARGGGVEHAARLPRPPAAHQHRRTASMRGVDSCPRFERRKSPPWRGSGGLRSALALPTRPGQWFGQQPGPAATVAPSSNCLGVCGALAGRERRACPPRGRSGVVSPAGGPPRAQCPAFRWSLLGGPASRHSQVPTAESARCSTAGTAELPSCPARGRGLPSSLLDDRRG